MAVQVQVASFTAEQGPKTVTFTTPAGNYALSPGNPTVTMGTAPGGCPWCTALVDNMDGTSSTTVSSPADFTGSIPVTLEDTP